MNEPSRFFSRWTDERVDELKAGWAEGKSASMIARDLNCGISRNAVIGKVNRMGLDHRKNSFALYTPKPKRKREPRQIRKNGRGYVERPVAEKPAPQLESLSEIEAQPAPSTFLGIALLDLDFGFNQCRYPRDVDGTTLFCGQPTIEESSYCRECHRRTHNGSFGRTSTFFKSRRAA